MRYIFAFTIITILSLIPISATTERLVPITNNNVQDLQLIATIGRGTSNTLDWNPDGTVLVVGSSAGVWLLNEQLEIIATTSVQEYISHVAWSPDGQSIAVVSNALNRCTIQIWDGSFSIQLYEQDICGDKALWSSNNEHLAVFDSDSSEVHVIDLPNGNTTALPGQVGAWSPDGSVLFTKVHYSRSYGGTPSLFSWDSETKAQLSVLEIEDIQPVSLLWTIDNHTLAGQCREYNDETDEIIERLCNLDVQSGEITEIADIFTTRLGICTCLFQLAWGSDETKLAYVYDPITPGFLATVGLLNLSNNERNRVGYGHIFDWKPNSDLITAIVGNGEIRTYNVHTEEVVAESQLFTASINMISIRPDSDEIASSSFGYEQDTLIWDIDQSLLESHLAFYIEPAELVQYTTDGEELIAGGTIYTDIVANQNIDAFNPDTGEDIRDIEAFYDQGASPPLRYWNTDYTLAAEVSADGIITLPNGTTIETANILQYVSWSPDYQFIATVERFPDDYSFIIRTWDVLTGTNINRYESGMFGFKGMVWSPNSTQIAVILEHPTGSNVYLRGVRVFTVTEDETYDFDQNDFQVFADVDVYQSDHQAQAAWNSDGTLLAIFTPNNLQIYNLNDEDEPIVSLPTYDIVDLEWSEDDKFIAGGSEDGVIYVWGVPSTDE